jgi:hypothetical protein
MCYQCWLLGKYELFRRSAGAMEGAHVKEELVLLLLIVAKQGWRRRRRRRGCSYEQSLILKAEDMYLVRFIPKINQYKHL